MKKLKFNNIWLVLAMSLGLTACLKDKDFEDGLYGSIKNTDGQEWLSIPVAAKNPNALGLSSKTGNQNIETFVISYDYKDPASQDISATVTVDNSGISDPDLVILPTSSYTLPANTITVKAGQRVSDPFILSINTSTLDPTKKYAIGFAISNVTKSGVQLSMNLSKVIYIISIKNKYDGIYTLKYRMDVAADRAPAWGEPYTYPYEIRMITTGPNSVVMYNTAFATGDNHPLMTPSVSGFGATRALFTFDVDDKLVSVVNDVPNPSNGRAFALNPAVTTSRYDPATKTIYAAFIMTQPGFEPLPIYDTLKFEKTRP